MQSRLFLTASLGSTSSDGNGTTTVSAYFGSAGDRDAACAVLRELPVALSESDRDPVDWLQQYEQSLHAIEIGESFIVAPDRALLQDSPRIPIVVPQEQAFGTGSHETTALCMTLLETIEIRGRRGLDIGSGSGILAIAASRLGAAKVIAFDNDLDAYAALRDNRQRNDVAPDRMPLFIGGMEAFRGGAFDFVLMNIIPEVIIPLLPQVVERMGDAARLIVSGILLERRDDVMRAAGGVRLTVEDEKSRGEWWAALFQRAR